jgi:hypothetical protein
VNDQFSNVGVASTFSITAVCSGILFDWSAYGFSFSLGLISLLSMGLLIQRHIEGSLK